MMSNSTDHALIPVRFTTLAMMLLVSLVSTAEAASEAAKVTTLYGRATAATADGSVRALSTGASIHAGDTIVTQPNSYIRMRFTDGSALLLRPNSRFQIEDYNLSEKAEENRGFFRLLKGGFRSVTGLIGKRNRNNYRIRTSVATIGIRGTDFEGRLCAGDCLDVDPPPADGLYVGVQENNVVFVENDAGIVELGAQQACFVASDQTPPEPLPTYPAFLNNPPCECPGL